MTAKIKKQNFFINFNFVLINKIFFNISEDWINQDFTCSVLKYFSDQSPFLNNQKNTLNSKINLRLSPFVFIFNININLF